MTCTEVKTNNPKFVSPQRFHKPIQLSRHNIANESTRTFLSGIRQLCKSHVIFNGSSKNSTTDSAPWRRIGLCLHDLVSPIHRSDWRVIDWPVPFQRDAGNALNHSAIATMITADALRLCLLTLRTTSRRYPSLNKTSILLCSF